MPDIQFRLANREDLDLLLDFMQRFYAIDNYDFDEPIARQTMQTLIEDPSLGRVWLIYSAQQPAGYIALTFGYSLEFRGRDSFIDEFFLLPAFRGQGLGTKTLDFVFEQARQLGIKAVHLEVEAHNEAGNALYRKMGFELHAQRAIMSKWLPRA